MPWQARLATSESLLPPLDYAEPADPSRSGPDSILIADPAAPQTNRMDGRPAPETQEPRPHHARATEAARSDQQLAALQRLSEEEIVALFG
jgi:hypothetical protein